MNKDYSGGLVPTPEEDIPLVAVESEAYAEFDRWIDSDLERLIRLWAHWVAPNANRAEVLRQRFGR